VIGIVHALIALVQLALGAFGIQRARNNPSLAILLVVAVILGLAYDNAVLALGAALDAGSALEALNTPRYWVHGLLTPLTMWAAFATLAPAGHPAGSSRVGKAMVATLTVGMVALGVWIDVFGLDLEPITEQGTTRYVNEFEPLAGPPLASVVTIVVVLIVGILLWRRVGWPWLAAGATVMFLAAAVPGPILVLQSVGEVAFAAGLVFTVTRDWQGTGAYIALAPRPSESS
jgi:hypothetical protein